MVRDTERLTNYERGYQLTSPVFPTQTLYSILPIPGCYMRKSKAPYEVEVVFIGINKLGGYFNVVYESGNSFGFEFSQLGEYIFYNREDAVEALKQ